MKDFKRITKAVIPAAGFGTRMLPATKALPKEMLPVAAKPMIQYAVEEAAASGIEIIILVVRRSKSVIHAHFGRDPELESLLEKRQQFGTASAVRRLAELAELRFVEQGKPLGLAHAISCACPLVGEEPFAVLLPDVIIKAAEPATLQLMQAYKQHGGSVVAIREIGPHEIERYGVVRASDVPTGSSVNSIRIAQLVEKPLPRDAPSRWGIFGRYVLEPHIWDAIAKTTRGAGGEVQLTDALNLLCLQRAIYGFFFEGQHYDTGDRIGYLKANIELSVHEFQQLFASTCRV
jgi:UTP--glucose-1-phosphate uridylyltransferase